MKNIKKSLLLIGISIMGALIPAMGAPVPQEPAARPFSESGAGQAAPPAFSLGFRGRPESNTNVGIKDATIHVRFYTEDFDPVAGQVIKEQVRLVPGVHDVRVRYTDAATQRPTEIPLQNFATFKPVNMAGTGFTVVYQFPGHPAVSLPMRLTKDDFSSGRANGVTALKYIDIKAPK